MRRRWLYFVDLFSRREQATTLACVRIGLGLVVLYSMVSALWAGLVSTLWIDIANGGFMPIRGTWVIRALGGATPAVIWSLFAVAVLAALLLVVGLFARFAALFALLAYAALVSVHGDTSGGADLMITNALWLLVFARSDATLSLSAWIRTRSFRSTDLVLAWPRYALAFQLIVIYTAAGWNKMSEPWTPMGGYSALHFVLQDPTFVRFGVDTFRGLSPLTRVATAVTWHWEQLTFLLLLYYYCADTADRGGRLRRWVLRFDWRIGWAAVGVLLHLGIFATLNVGAFSMIALAYYFALWRPEELADGFARVARRFRAMVGK